MALNIPIVLDKPRNLRFGYRAMEAIELETGRGFLEIVNECLSNKSPKLSTMKILIWGALKKEDPDITPDQVTDILDEMDNLAPVISAIQKGVESALKDPDKKKKEPVEKLTTE